MGEITSGCTFTPIGFALGQSEYFKLIIKTEATADTGDTIIVPSGYGGTILSIIGFDSDTCVQEQPTWVVATRTITLGGSGNNNKTRVYEVLMAR